MTAWVLAVLGLLLTVPLPAQQQHARSGPRSELPPTQFCSQLLTDNLLMVVGTVEQVTLFGIGTAVVRLRIDEHLSGERPDASSKDEEAPVLILAYAREFHSGSQALLVLEPFGEGGRFRVRYRIDARDADFRAKVEMSRRQVALVTLPDKRAREEGVIDLLVRSLASDDAWTRSYALSELQWIATVYPEVLDATRMRRLRSIALASRWPEVTDGVESVAIELARRTQALRARADEESSSP